MRQLLEEGVAGAIDDVRVPRRVNEGEAASLWGGGGLSLKLIHGVPSNGLARIRAHEPHARIVFTMRCVMSRSLSSGL
jgi:hypothetical protein